MARWYTVYPLVHSCLLASVHCHKSLVWLKVSAFRALTEAPHEYPVLFCVIESLLLWICKFTTFTDVVVGMGHPAFSIRLPALRWLTPLRKVFSTSLKLKQFHSCLSQFVWQWADIQLLVGMEILITTTCILSSVNTLKCQLGSHQLDLLLIFWFSLGMEVIAVPFFQN